MCYPFCTCTHVLVRPLAEKTFFFLTVNKPFQIKSNQTIEMQQQQKKRKTDTKLNLHEFEWQIFDIK